MAENDAGATLGEVEKVDEVIEQPKTMDDTIRDTLRGLQDKGIEPDKEEGEAQPTPEEKAQRIRDDKGKFAVKAEEPAAEVPVKAAPNTWKKEVADKWGTLPPEVQAEVERREADFHKGIEGYKAKAQMAETFERAINPYMATINSLGVTPDKAVSELMAADHRLRYGSPQEKNAYFAQLARSYGIDLANVQQPQQQYIDPNVSHLQNQVQQLNGWIQQQTMMGQQREQEALNSTLEAFKSDPSHSHFESVRGHMATLLQAGDAKDLESAYEQAVWANPTTRPLMLQQQEKAKREEANLKAQAAKNAASVNTRNRPSMPVSQPIGSMDDTIRATLRKLQSA